MKGTAILFQEDHITFIENIDYTLYQEMKEQCGCDNCTCRLSDKLVDFGTVSPVFWHENEVDWDYGY